MRWKKFAVAGSAVIVLATVLGLMTQPSAYGQNNDKRLQGLSSAIGTQVTIALGRPETPGAATSGANAFSGVTGKLVSFDDQWLVVEMAADNQYDHIWVERSRVIYVGSKRSQ